MAIATSVMTGCLFTWAFAILNVVPTYENSRITKEALELSQWTAVKDFLQACWERQVN